MAAGVVKAPLQWIDPADMASQSGKAAPNFARPDGTRIFQLYDDYWWLTQFEIREHAEEFVNPMNEPFDDEELTIKIADAG